MDPHVTSRPASDRRTRPYGLVGVLALAVGLLIAGNLFALRTEAVFAADAGGFIVFVNAIGLLAMTLVAYALFQAVRRRVQMAVDRRFDRAHDDTERSAAAFADRLRHDADLDTVTDELRTVVEQSVRPTASGIWLHESSRR